MRKLSPFIVAALASADFTLSTHAAELPDIKPGLWDMTIAVVMKGQLPLSDAELAKIPAERRAMMQAVMKGVMANAGKPRKFKVCVSEEQLKKGFSFDTDNSPGCKRTIVKSSATEMTMHEECTGDSPRVIDAHYRASTPEAITGDSKVAMTRAGHTMNASGKVDGTWLGADCGTLKPGQTAKE
jgi:hypothetical protein